MREGKFRQDLFYRLNVIPLRLPALSERGDDVTLLAEYFAGKYASAYGMGVHITPRFGISIPVILRVGDTTLSAGLASPGVINLPTGGKALRLRITREGTRSAFGDLAVTAPGAKSPVALLRGVGVYTEIDSREVTLPFDPKADPKSYASGAKLTITYTDDDADPGKVLAKQDYVVP